MLPGFKICCLALEYAVWIKIVFALSCVLSVPMTRKCLYFDAQIGDITRTAPFQTRLGVGQGQTATTRRQSSWLPRAPWELERPSPLATSSEVLPGLSQYLCEGILAFHGSTFESLGDICSGEPSSQRSWPRRRRIEFNYPSPFEK